MRKSFILILFIVVAFFNVKAQDKPVSYILADDGRNLSKINSENPTGNGITDIIVIGDTIWLGTGKGLSLSTDNGENWTNFFGTPDFGSESISAMAYDNGTLWVSTASNTEANGETLPQGTGLRYTIDNGQTWTSIPQPVDAEDDTVEIYGINSIIALPVTVAIQNITFDIAITKNTVWIASFAGGLRKTTDNGATWQRVVIPPDYLDEISPDDTLDFCLSPVAGSFCSESNLNHRVFSIAAADSTTLYVGTAGGINKSTDNGISWRKFSHQNQDEPISGNFIVGLGYNTANNTVWAASWRAEGETEFYGVNSSSDGGESWKTFLEDERAHNFGFKGNDVIAATDNGAFRSPDDGLSWILPTSIVDENSGLTLQTTTFFSAASGGNQVWLGSDDGLARITESFSGVWSGEWKIFFASSPLSSTTETYAYPNPFSPKRDQLKIKYSTGGKSANVTIRIFNFSMNYVATVVQNVQRGNPVSQIDGSNGSANGVIDFWDGRDAAGNTVPNGVYFYRVEVDSNEPVFGKILVLQ